MAINSIIEKEILVVLPISIRNIIAKIPTYLLDKTEEIRIRENKPLMLVFHDGDVFIGTNGTVVNTAQEAYQVTKSDTLKTLQLMSNSSIYALEEELRSGYLTIPGGHRVGLVGKVILEKGKVRTMKYISGFNIRISRQIVGTANKVLKYMINHAEKRIMHTLIISPPQCGKTTLLRDIIRQLSNTISELNWHGIKIGVVDERSEIAGCYEGVPQHDLGLRTDVLDACPKAEGMMMLLRSMSPDVIATDEIGRPEDVIAIRELLNAGVKVLTTIHGSSVEELFKRPSIQELMVQGVFERFILLGRTFGVGTVEDVIDGKTMTSILKKSKPRQE